MLVKGTTLAPRRQSKIMNTTEIDPRPNDAATVAPSDGSLKQKKRKKDKVRSAWISFVGRIVAQFIGAVATIVLGVMFVQKYADKPRVAPEPAATIRFEFVVEVPASRPANQADVAAAVAREVVAATQHAAAMNGSVAFVRGGAPAATQ
jgi:hypothetical protein